VAQAKIENKTYRFDPFSPFKIWLNASGIPIGMSSSDRYVFVVKDGQINTTERMSWSLNRLLKSELQKDDTYKKPEGFDDDDEDEEDYQQEEDNFMLQHLLNNPFNHSKWTEVVREYYMNPLTTPQPDIKPAQMDELLKVLEEQSPTMKDIIVSCNMMNGDVRVVRIDMKVDLSDQDGLDVVDCEINKDATLHEFGISVTKEKGMVAEGEQ
jgi:hypothetical protein